MSIYRTELFSFTCMHVYMCICICINGLLIAAAEGSSFFADVEIFLLTTSSNRTCVFYAHTLEHSPPILHTSTSGPSSPTTHSHSHIYIQHSSHDHIPALSPSHSLGGPSMDTSACLRDTERINELVHIL